MVRLTRLAPLLSVTLALACGGGAGDSRSSTGISETGITDTFTDSNESSGADMDQGDGDPGGLPKWDLGGIPDSFTNCADSGVDETKSYIWIANSSQSTVSKINTVTLVEEGRYSTRATPGNPSRTSVALSGNVAVANRSGGVAKFYFDAENCPDTNGVPGIQTSTGANDVLPFGSDECLAWYADFAYSTQRPVAWSYGEFNEGSCTYENEKVWTAGGLGNAEVLLLDGDTGVTEETVVIPNVIGWAGLYGGAVDGLGNFWTVDHNWNGPSTLIRVDGSNFTYDEWETEVEVHYGLTVDSNGRAWLCGSGGASRFDPQTETWAHSPPINGGSALGGCMEDPDGILWNAAYPNAVLVGIDTTTVQVVQMINIPSYVHGVSIDFQGNLWGVEFSGDEAFRINKNTLQIDTVGGLVGAYTYSDMTGYALSAAGGVPSG